MCMHAQKEKKEKRGKGESLVGYCLCQCSGLSDAHSQVYKGSMHLWAYCVLRYFVSL